MQPMGSMSPGQMNIPSPQPGFGIGGGQWKGHMSPSGMQISGIMQPMMSMAPGQLFMPSPQAMGGIGGQGAGKARAVERRANSRRDILRLDNSAFSAPTDPNLYPKSHVTYSVLCYFNLCPLIHLPLVMLQVLLFSYSPILVIVSFTQSRVD